MISERQPGKVMRLHLSEGDEYQGKPLYAAIINKCLELDVSGTTVLRGIEGFGESLEMHRSGLLNHDRPVVIQIVETAEKVESILPELQHMLGNGMIAVSDVELLRVEKISGPATP